MIFLRSFIRASPAIAAHCSLHWHRAELRGRVSAAGRAQSIGIRVPAKPWLAGTVHALRRRAKEMSMNKSPGHAKWPDHQVKELHSDQHVRVEVDGQLIADSRNVVRVDE